MTARARSIEVLPDAQALIGAAADRFVRAAKAAVHAHGRFAVALSGGSTPKGLYQRLATDAALVGATPWPHVHIFWGDERTVPPDHADSNFKMAKEALLDHVPIPAAHIHRMKGEIEPEAAAAEYEADVRAFFKLAPGAWPRFDLVLLGLGPDGHTASLFPGTTALAERSRLVVSNFVPKFDTHRITFTAPALNAAAEIVFLSEGAGKAAMLKEVLEGPVDTDRLPSQLIHAENGTLTWMVDQAAAGGLTKGA